MSARPSDWIAISIVAAADQATKAFAIATLGSGRVVELGPLLNLRLGFNPGVAFGFLSLGTPAARWALTAATTLIVIGLVVWMRREASGMARLALAIIAGGAIGNIVDRLRQGAVTDFIDLHWAHHHWPTFNGADAAIVVGILLLLTARRTTATGNQRIAA